MPIMKIDYEKNIITFFDNNLCCKEVIYGEYSENADITFIMKDTIKVDTEKCISTEVIGFYYGKPDIENIKEYSGKLKAEF